MSALRRRAVIAAISVAVALACLVPATASAAFGIASADLFFSQEDGSAATLAGSHPFQIQTTFKLNTTVDPGGAVDPVSNEPVDGEVPDGSLKDLEVQLPVGLAGIPKAVPQCSGADFATLAPQTEQEKVVEGLQPVPSCSPDSAIGYVWAGTSFKPYVLGSGTSEWGQAALYNLEPAPGTVAKFGFIFAKVPVTIEVKLSEEAPYRVVAILHNAPQPLLLYGSTVTVWGNPAAAAHDPYRGNCLKGIEPDGTPVSRCSQPYEGGAEEAFLTLPRACAGPLGTGFGADSWEGAAAAAVAVSTHDAAGAPQGFEGCGELGFEPAVSATSSSGQAESPTGLGFTAGFAPDPGLTDPAGRAHSDLRKIVVGLPEGMTLNPSAAEGLAGCTTAQYESERLTTAPGAGCPAASKIGTVRATSPLVDEALEGAIFTAAPYDNPFGSFLGIYLVLRNQNLGVIVRQAGEVDADPTTGRLTATFAEAPQLPITAITTRFREGPRAPLATPTGCGTYTATATETSWAGSEAVRTSEFDLRSGPGGSACPSGPGPLSPALSAGTTSAAAASYSPLVLHLTRNDGEADLTHLSVALPAGLSGKLAGVGRCPEAAIAAISSRSGDEESASPSCPSSSRIGTVHAGAGVGPALTWVTGSAYLAGPYMGAPFSVVVVTPAVAGPFDLGNVVIRDPLRIDPFTARVTVDGSASPLPRILKGIPLRLRDLQVDIDRPGFTLNASGCEPGQIAATLSGAGPSLSATSGPTVTEGARYQASGCQGLGFKPKLQLSLKGSTTRTGHPALKAVLTYPRQGAYSNVARAQVNLPHSEFIEQANLNKTCTKPVLLEGRCPKSTIYGRAKAWTPLLDEPLEGNVYLVGGFGFKLPALVAELDGQIRVLLAGKVDSGPNGGIRNTFEAVPDAPVEKFELNLKGGPRYSLLVNSENLCRKPQKAIARFTAQDGKVLQTKPTIANDCGKGKGGKKKSGKGPGKKK
jgi:hypothetical protein